MSKVSSVLVFFGFLTLSGTSIAQTPDFLVESWTVADGLPSTNVFGLAHGPDGFLWVGTDKGVARFDGVQFTAFTHENLPGLRSDHVQHMATGPDGQLYIATWGGGLTAYNHGRARAFAKAEGLKSNVVQVVVPVGDEEAWFGTDFGYLYHYRKGSIVEVGTDVLPRQTIYGLAKAPDGTMWIGTGNGLFYLSHGTVSRYQPKVPLPVTAFFDLAITVSGNIFAGSDQGLFEIKGDHWRSWTRKTGLPSDRIQVMATAPGDVLWIGTDMGVAQLVNGRAKPVRTPFCSVTALAFDVERSLWVGCSQGQSLLRLTTPPVGVLSLSGKHRWIAPQSLIQDQAGAVWMGTAHGLVQWRNNRSTLYTRKDGLPSSNITALSLAPDSSVWIGTENGFAKLRNGTFQSFRTEPPGPENPIYSIKEDRRGNLWVVASDRLMRRRPGQKQFQEVPNVSGFVWSLREDSEGNIWASTRSSGLIRLSGDSQSSFTTECGLASNMVYDSVETAPGEVWAGSEGGLSRVRDGKCLSIKVENGLPPGRVVAVEHDSQGHLWLKTPAVTVALDLAEANRVADRGGMLANTRIFSDEDGFGRQLSVASSNSILRHSSGEMWFSTRGGIGRIDPAILRTKVPPLKPQVDSVASDAGERNLSGSLVVSPGDLHLRFAYSAPSLIGANTRQFRYRLTGFDQEWRLGGKQRDAVYTSLPPGKYQFQVSVRRPFEAWSDSSAPLDIRILPNFYQTWWWYLLLTVVSIAGILLVYHLRLLTVRRQYALLMTERLRERSRLARELHDTLARGMVGIHIQVEAAQVLLDVEPGSVRKHLDNVESIAREALIETRSSITELRSQANENPTLRDVLQESTSNFARSSAILLTVTIKEDLPQFSPDVNHEIHRFAEEALANVRLHSGAHIAHLNVCRQKKAFLLELRDDGKGFEVDASGEIAGHFGIIGMRERAKRINGQCHITSGSGKGTRVVLEVPFRSSWLQTRILRSPSTLAFCRNLYTLRLKMWASMKRCASGERGPFSKGNA